MEMEKGAMGICLTSDKGSSAKWLQPPLSVLNQAGEGGFRGLHPHLEAHFKCSSWARKVTPNFKLFNYRLKSYF